MTLESLPQNPVPQGCLSGHLQMPGKQHLRYAHWPCHENADHKGTIVFLQGRAEFIEIYFPMVEHLRARGFAPLLFDWRGQGGSSRLLRNRKTGHIPEFSFYQEDLDMITHEIVLPDCRPPYYLLTYSMGGTIFLLSAPRLQNQYSRAVCASPLLGIVDGVLTPLYFQLGIALPRYFGFGSTIYPLTYRWSRPYKQSFHRNLLTSDPLSFARIRHFSNKAPHLVIDAPSLDWVYACTKALNDVSNPALLEKIHMPILFILAGNDQIVSNRITRTYAKDLPTASCVTIPGAKHALFHEQPHYRELLWAAFDRFIPGEDRTYEEEW